MTIKQLSVFIENRPGRLAEITGLLAEKNIDIRALSLADTSDFGILRLIVNHPDTACATLLEAGAMVRTTEVLAVSMKDQPGGFSTVVKILSDAGIDIEYLYAFLSRQHGEAVVILRVDDSPRSAQLLSQQGIQLLDPSEIYNL